MWLVLLIAAATTTCAKNSHREPANSVPAAWDFEGWACEPDPVRIQYRLGPAQNCDEKERDYLYARFAARSASTNLPPHGREASCRAAARRQISDYRLAKVLGVYWERYDIHSDTQMLGVAILYKHKDIVNSARIYDCCPLHRENYDCAKASPNPDWTTCYCVSYLRFPGGKKGFIKTIREIHLEQ